jgi:hypothetical protein
MMPSQVNPPRIQEIARDARGVPTTASECSSRNRLDSEKVHLRVAELPGANALLSFSAMITEYRNSRSLSWGFLHSVAVNRKDAGAPEDVAEKRLKVVTCSGQR